MDFRRKFEFGLAWRTLVLIGAILLVAKAASTPGVRAGLVVAALIGATALASLWNFIRRTNFLVSRFIESVRFEDYSQRFSDPSGGGFDVLGATLDQALKTLQARHTRESAESRYLAAIVDDAPSALLAVDRRGRVEVLNKAARQLFARLPLHRLDDLEALGPELAAAVRLPAGTRKITRLMLDRGYKISQFPCLNKLWNRESGWNHKAYNEGSGAYGIPQALPGSKMQSAGSDWKTNPATQIKWGLGYIKDRYGNPCNAWQHSEDAGWY